MRPRITLTTDFGLRDSYVAQVKAVLLQFCSDANIVDITHDIPRHDIVSASFTLERAVATFSPGTVHLAVVDPGVGTRRRLLVVHIARQFIVCPDNGLITWTWRLHGPGKVWRIANPPKTASPTFHGRDILAPVAAQLALGESIKHVLRPIDKPILLNLAPANPPRTKIRIIHIDAFGNATTNLPQSRLGKSARVTIKGIDLGPLKRTYSDVPPGQPLALIGSAGLLEIAAREASAAQVLNIRTGDEVEIVGGGAL